MSHLEDVNNETIFHMHLKDDNGTSESDRFKYKDIPHTLLTLNDCIWCTNVFVEERELERNIRTGETCTKRKKNSYSSDDTYKELIYMEIILNRLLQNVLPLTGRNIDSFDFDTAEDFLNKSGMKESPDDVDAGVLTQLSRIHDEKEQKVEKMLCRKSATHGEALHHADSSEVESIHIISPSTECEDVRHRGFANPKNADSPLALMPLVEIIWRKDVHEKQTEINEKIKLTNRLLEVISRNGALDEYVRAMNESLVRKRNEIPADLKLIKNSGCTSVKSCNPFRATGIDSLLFDKEKWRVEAVRRNGGDPLEHLCGIALPLEYDSFKRDTRSTYYGIKRKNLLSISLQTADMSEDFRKTQFQNILSFFMLLLSISLYFSDLVSDLILAGDHYTNGNTHYAVLTLTFVIAPLIAETLSKMILKLLGWDKEYGKLKWRDVFNLNDFKILKWMACSINYSLNSMKNYHKFDQCYSELHSYRRNKGKKEYSIVRKSAIQEEINFKYMHTVFSSMLAWNERFTLQTKLAESLNESAPQLLLQLTIVIRQFIVGDNIGFISWICIATSVLSLAWSMHMAHYNRHYHTGGRVLNNSFEWRSRIVEFVGNCLVYGSRLTSICMVTSVLGVLAIVGTFVYLTAIYYIMITFSGRKRIYKTLHRYKTTIFWPLHRLFTLPYRIGIWRMDSVDHLLFYLETICLALSLPFLLPADVNHISGWIATGCVLSFEALGIALLYIFKIFFHPYGYVCENR